MLIKERSFLTRYACGIKKHPLAQQVENTPYMQVCFFYGKKFKK